MSNDNTVLAEEIFPVPMISKHIYNARDVAKMMPKDVLLSDFLALTEGQRDFTREDIQYIEKELNHITFNKMVLGEPGSESNASGQAIRHMLAILPEQTNVDDCRKAFLPSHRLTEKEFMEFIDSVKEITAERLALDSGV